MTDTVGQDVQLPLPSRVAHTTVRQVAGLGAGYGSSGYSLSANGMLHREALHGHLETVEKLLQMKQGEEIGVSSFQSVVDVNGYDDQGQLPLLLAAAAGHTEICKVLLKYKASVDMRKQNNGLSALHFACQDGHVETARVLVACGANVNAAASIPGEAGRVRGDQTAPLHSAVISGHVEMAEALLKGMEYKGITLKADPNQADGAQQTPLHRAASKGFDRLCQLLFQYGANVDALDSNGETPVFHAIESRSLPTVEVLLNAGANPNAVSTYGQTPMRMCAGVVHRVKVVQISGARISKEQHNEEHTVTLMMEFLSDFEGVLNPRDRFFDLGVPSYLAKASKQHYERLENQEKGFGFISNEVADEQRQKNQTRGFGWLTDLEVEELLRQERKGQ